MARFRLIGLLSALLLPLALTSGCGCSTNTGTVFDLAGFRGRCSAAAETLVRGTGGDGANNATVLDDGSSYVMGWYGNADSVLGPNDAVALENGADTGWAPFVSRYDPDGALVWAIYGLSDATSNPWNTGAVWHCPDGGSVFCVAHRGVVSFRDGLGAVHETEGGHSGFAMAVVRSDAEGRILWIQRVASPGASVFGFGVRCSPFGEIVIAGGSLQGGTFGASWDPGAQTIDTPSGSLAFVWKIEPSGRTAWVTGNVTGHATSHPYYNGILQLRVDPKGNYLVSGMVRGGVTLQDGTVLGAGTGVGDGYVASYTGAGELRYAYLLRSNTAGQRVTMTAAVPGPDDGAYVGFDHHGDVLLPDGQVIARRTPYDGASASSVVRLLGPAGATGWWRTLRTTSRSNASSFSALESGEDGRLILGGKYPAEGSSISTLGGAEPEVLLEGYGSADALLLRLEADGSIAWVRSDGGPGYDHACGVVLMPNGCLYVTGFSGGEATFGRGTAYETTLVSDGGWDGWRYLIGHDGAY